MKPALPKEILLLDGRRFPVDRVHHQMGRGQFRVSWIDERPKGCVAEVHGDEFREVDRSASPAVAP